MKRILFYTDTTQIGGAELQMFLLAKFLNKELITPIIACSADTKLDSWCLKFAEENIHVIRMNVKHKHDPNHYKILKKIITENGIDILHAHVWNPASCRYAFMQNIPLIITEHDPFKLNPIKNIFKKIALKKTKKIVTVSQENAKLIKKLYPDQKNKVSVIHNGLDLTWWNSQLLRFTEEDLEDIKVHTFEAHKDTLIITTIAELHPRKGIKYLIAAMPKIIEKYPNVKLIIIGEGEDKERLEKLTENLKINNCVKFLGRRKEIAKLLKASNIFVLPSIREAFGMVNLEAMYTPLPIVASKVGGIPEIIEDGKTGILVPKEDTMELRIALEKLIKNPELRNKMANAGKERLQKEFSAKKMAEKYEKIYKNIN
ncbi:hypothetical protein COU74_03935 [Candidatus Peregrinibacteria bacterium CG10_big_fil_rev_8_21_14_0_10_36_19]|nr:MAG: hypothetical protein COU74_03935 [Candidatus Peregrinibacteria bacterium CG10_big_fil_rev_8_21_14_0_10_36_19]